MSTTVGSSPLLRLEDRPVARDAVVGTLIGVVVLTAFVTAMMHVFGSADWLPSLGVGLFAASWGGPGFGGMLGAILAAERLARDRAVSMVATAGRGDDVGARIGDDRGPTRSARAA